MDDHKHAYNIFFQRIYSSVYPQHARFGTEDEMATASFYEMMIIDTPEACVNLVKAFEYYGKYDPYVSGKPGA
ncbi:MAG: hypothetical protein IKC93_01480 [Candidatus Methanomethylophilaceae archaeon]|nr:hypothetical protein [Candidatus Methanomethylophilaceae archaeon]